MHASYGCIVDADYPYREIISVMNTGGASSQHPCTAASAQAAAERIRGRLRAAFIETGRDLLAQKAALGHGQFLPWVEAEFGMSARSAQELMSIS
jgi:Protein of unknown function (DUF3102)